MPQIEPIPNTQWLTEHVKPRMIKMYGTWNPWCLCKIMQHNIRPEHVVRKTVTVEFMLACLQEGAWLPNHDWRTYSRYAIAKRIRVHLNKVFQAQFIDIKDEFLDYQLNHGTFRQRDKLAKFAAKQIMSVGATQYAKAASKLILSVTDEVMENAVIQPYHWIRVLVALSDPNPQIGFGLMNREMMYQKATLAMMLQATE